LNLQIGTSPHERAHNVDVVIDNRQHERRQVILRSVVQLGALINQEPNQACSTISCPDHQRCLTVAISRVNISALSNQTSDAINVSSVSGLFPLGFQWT